MKKTLPLRTLLSMGAFAALPLGGLAQPAALAPGQVSGAEIQSWFDADAMTVAGLNLVKGCAFMAQGTAPRRQTVYCPTMLAYFTVTGEAKVVGHQLCSNFTYPDGSKVEACQDVFKIGDNKYELRVNGTPRVVIYRLLR